MEAKQLKSNITKIKMTLRHIKAKLDNLLKHVGQPNVRQNAKMT